MPSLSLQQNEGITREETCTTYQVSMSIISKSCANFRDFPLFSDSSCVSPGLYTVLFLLNIILASLVFLMLIGLVLLLVYRRQVRRIQRNADELPTPDIIISEKAVISTSKSEKEISNVLRQIVSNTPLEASPQTHLHHSFPLPSAQESLLASSSSFEDSYTSNNRPLEGPYFTKHIVSTIFESNESTGKNSSIYQPNSTRL